MNNSQNKKQKEKEWRRIKDSDIRKLNTKHKINGCINCKYEDRDVGGMPCRKCSHQVLGIWDRWEKR